MLKTVEVGGSCDKYAGRKILTVFWCGKMKDADRLEETVADGTIFLNCILNLLEGRLRTRFNWLEIGKNCQAFVNIVVELRVR